MSHEGKKSFPDDTKLSDLISFLSEYVPSMRNVVWAIISLNTSKKVIGYLVTDESCNPTIDIENDISINNLFAENPDSIQVFCRYYHNGSFSWRSGVNGCIVNKHPESQTLIGKVKLECKEN